MLAILEQHSSEELHARAVNCKLRSLLLALFICNTEQDWPCSHGYAAIPAGERCEACLPAAYHKHGTGQAVRLTSCMQAQHALL